MLLRLVDIQKGKMKSIDNNRNSQIKTEIRGTPIRKRRTQIVLEDSLDMSRGLNSLILPRKSSNKK